MSDEPATRIQDAATALFAERGFEGTSVRDIAQHAGVTAGSINYYFGSKGSLHQECGRRLAQEYLTEARGLLESEGPLAVLEHYADYAIRDPKLVQIWLDLQGARDPEKRAFSDREIMHPIQLFLMEALGQMGDAPMDRRMKMICFVGAVILRSMFTEEQFKLLAGTSTEEGNVAFKEVLFSKLIDD
ncbi:MAG: TetR/AcrR family transcriptional regulator [Candidatus Binatia bacterium]|nr:TetR/AcrR family transcriptional regulator [Candidatus Binatia bacterium]